MFKLNDDVLLVGEGAGFLSVEALTGVYAAFEEFGNVPGYVRASSGSSLFSSLYYSGLNANWFHDLMRTTQVSDWVKPAISDLVRIPFGLSNRIYDNSKVKELLRTEMTAEATKRVKVSVTCLDDYSSHMKSATPTWTSAAISIPFVFIPIRNSDKLWGDGGVTNNIPFPSVAEAKTWKRIFVFLAPPTRLEGPPVGISGLINLLAGLRTQEYVELKGSGALDAENVTVIQAKEDFGAGVLNWSDGFKLRECYKKLTLEMLYAGC